jgi:hypothetical protein
MNKLSSEAKAMRARIINWQSPTVDDLKSIRTVEQMGEQLLDAILLYCPNNHERSEALDLWKFCLLGPENQSFGEMELTNDN